MEIQPLDIAATAIIVAATLRGLFVGLVREGFSLAALGAAYLAVQLFTPPATEWVLEVSNGDVGPNIANIHCAAARPLPCPPRPHGMAPFG